MNGHFARALKMVSVVHAALLAVLLCGSMLQGCFHRKPEIAIPVEFVVAAPIDISMDDLAEVPMEASAPEEMALIPEPVKKPDPVRKPEPVKKAEPVKKKEIQVSRTKIVRKTSAPSPREPPLSAEEIRRRLAMGAQLSDHTSAIPDSDLWCKELVRRKLYEAYEPPSASDVAGNKAPEVKIWLGPGGSVTRSELAVSSGNGAWDEAALRAARSVNRIEGLAADFLERYSSLSIAFKVEE